MIQQLLEKELRAGGGYAFLVTAFISVLSVFVVAAFAAADTIELPDGSVYTGERRGNLLHGEGELRWADGRHYAGEFRNGLIQGQGVLVYRNGDRYEGQFERGLRHGHGRFTTSEGERV